MLLNVDMINIKDYMNLSYHHLIHRDLALELPSSERTLKKIIKLYKFSQYITHPLMITLSWNIWCF